jgi:hypothetical protein
MQFNLRHVERFQQDRWLPKLWCHSYQGHQARTGVKFFSKAAIDRELGRIAEKEV